MVHVTCLAHALHRLSEAIRDSFPDVDSLIAEVKKTFVKAPLRVKVFREETSTTPLPPEPILTRWGTWISAASYYAANLEPVVPVVNKLHSKAAAAVRKSKELVCQSDPKSHLAFIASNFSSIPESIEKFECSSKHIATTPTLAIIGDLERRIATMDGPRLSLLKTKFSKIHLNNSGLKTMRLISKAIQADGIGRQVSEYTACELAAPAFSYAPLVSVDVLCCC